MSMYIARICPSCNKPAGLTGGGVRLFMGGRHWVCVACKTAIDKRKKK